MVQVKIKDKRKRSLLPLHLHMSMMGWSTSPHPHNHKLIILTRFVVNALPTSFGKSVMICERASFYDIYQSIRHCFAKPRKVSHTQDTFVGRSLATGIYMKNISPSLIFTKATFRSQHFQRHHPTHRSRVYHEQGSLIKLALPSQ